MASRLALLAGLFVAPAVLLWLGHRLRRRTPRMRAVFWGATIGYVLGMLATLWAMHLPPVLWDEGGGWRTAAVHWGMLAGAAIGAGAGMMRAGARGRHPP